MKAADPVRLIEAAYTYVPDETEWLDSMVEGSLPYDVGSGVVAMTLDLGDRPRVRASRASSGAKGAPESIASFVGTLSPKLARSLFAPTEFVGNSAFRFERLLGVHGRNAVAKRAPVEVPPLWALVGGDGVDHAVLLGFPSQKRGFDRDKPFPHRDRRVLGLVAAHFGAALRLRNAAGVAPRPLDDEVTEAVLSPEGRVLDATGVGRSPVARRSLSEAVVRAERARGKLRRTDGDEATQLWKALVAGRWSIVEIVERDGKRLLLARANPPASPDLTALTKQERDVVWLIGFGHSYKYVAYELGLGISSVVRRLGRAMLKLGVSNRSELLRKLAR